MITSAICGYIKAGQHLIKHLSENFLSDLRV